MKKQFPLKIIICLAILFISKSGSAQATRTWVSGLGDDVNPASRTAPCKTFAGAISKTAAGGEINAIDPGGYGAVTITKSITVDGAGTFASILGSGTTGVIINAGTDGVVILRHLNINGAGTGINGVKILAAKKVVIEDCMLSNFTQQGVEINTTSACTILMNNVTIHNAANAVNMTSPGGVVIIDGCKFQSFSNAGINLVSGQATVNGSNISDCVLGVVNVSGTTASLSNNVISHNGTALKGTGTFASAGNNLMVGNGQLGSATTVIQLK